MAKPLVDDRRWALLEPLIPPALPRPRGGRPRIPDRATLTGILFVMVWIIAPLWDERKAVLFGNGPCAEPVRDVRSVQ
jgi:hypothetical protein